MEEELELRNVSLSRDGVETTVMIPPSTSVMDAPAKSSPLHMHRLRNLAIASIICGCSCIGVLALIYAIKASEKQKAGSHDSAAYWAQKSRFTCFLSVGVCMSLLILVFLLLVLLSYLLSQAEL
ncbi:transmembrane protein 265 [Rhineura floridana]|uniref:transmembrane protein 265 n=1 Tax=Rhineura floridana TaxID=261503 RepID=UPI002AC86DE7|nr:transmembrane protein 265 [Rhineura floridana]